MLLRAVAESIGDSTPGADAFGAGYDLLTQVQAIDPEVEDWLVGLPHLGGWGHDCLTRLEQGGQVDLAYLAWAGAAAGVRAGVAFELDVPVRDGHVRLPGLGAVRITGEPSWVRLRCDGSRVVVDGHFEADRYLLVPDDGSAAPVPQWRGTPLLRAVADDLSWDVLLETGDLYLDRYTLPMATALAAGEIARWRQCVQSAWEILVNHHRWAAESIAGGLSVIVPLTPHSDSDLISATSPAAFGAIATSWPPDAVTLAETLVHEFQHVKLSGLLDLVRLVEPGGENVYAPWRQDPRPAGGLLQGVYAHLGIARFWSAQQHVEKDADDVLRAQASFARWLSTIDPVTRTLLDTGCLTEVGVRFVNEMRARARALESEPLPDDVRQIAAEAALDHQLTWQFRHTAIDTRAVKGLVTAYQRGESFRDQEPVKAGIQADTRKVCSTVRGQLLNERYLAPARYRKLRAEGVPTLDAADDLLCSGETDAAIRAYIARITDSADLQPDAWIGLALAMHRLTPSPRRAAFATHLPLMFDVHSCLGHRADPLQLADWFA